MLHKKKKKRVTVDAEDPDNKKLLVSFFLLNGVIFLWLLMKNLKI